LSSHDRILFRYKMSLFDLLLICLGGIRTQKPCTAAFFVPAAAIID
jgi:hypothetical protein